MVLTTISVENPMARARRCRTSSFWISLRKPWFCVAFLVELPWFCAASDSAVVARSGTQSPPPQFQRSYGHGRGRDLSPPRRGGCPPAWPRSGSDPEPPDVHRMTLGVNVVSASCTDAGVRQRLGRIGNRCHRTKALTSACPVSMHKLYSTMALRSSSSMH